jgi:hypothetical protein
LALFVPTTDLQKPLCQKSEFNQKTSLATNFLHLRKIIINYFQIITLKKGPSLTLLHMYLETFDILHKVNLEGMRLSKFVKIQNKPSILKLTSRSDGTIFLRKFWA